MLSPRLHGWSTSRQNSSARDLLILLGTARATDSLGRMSLSGTGGPFGEAGTMGAGCQLGLLADGAMLSEALGRCRAL
jgi:hypothetical protein